MPSIHGAVAAITSVWCVILSMKYFDIVQDRSGGIRQ
jgi:hypothetical protein